MIKQIEYLEARIAKVQQLLHDELEHLGEFREEHLLLCSEKQEYEETQLEIKMHETELKTLQHKLREALQKVQEEIDRTQLKLEL